MSAVAWFAMYPTDFLAGVGHLGNTELGIYWRLLLVYYRDGGPLSSDTDRLRRLALAFTPEEHRSLDAVVAEFFSLSTEPDGRRVWRHKRADIEIARACGARKKKSEAARATNERRWGKTQSGSLIESLSDSVSDSLSGREPEPEPEPEKERTAAVPPGLPLGDVKKTKPRKRKSELVTLATWLEDIKVKGEKPVPADDPIFEYAKDVGLPRDFLELAWRVFKRKHLELQATTGVCKTYADWRQAFRNAVRENWYRLWYADQQPGGYALTTAGTQEQRLANEEQPA